MNKGKVTLKKLICNGNDKYIEFLVESDNPQTHLDQTMVIEFIHGKWVASIDLDEFPAQDSAKNAAHKLGEWLERLGSAINEESEAFETIKL